MASNANLQRANKEKNDEFYTQLVDIERELSHYKNHFKGKIIFCNCDDPYESNFFRYFALNFNYLGLKKLICTCYDNSPIAYTQLNMFGDDKTTPNPNRRAYKIEINQVIDYNNDGATDLADVEHLLKNKQNALTLLQGNGDFRSDECVELLKQVDIVVTNPPFSLFREYLAQILQYEKQFLIIGNINAVTYKEVFPLLKADKIWMGYIFNKTLEFEVPNEYKGAIRNGKKYGKVPSITWFTNLETTKRHEELILYEKFNAEKYPHYDNYDAINVDKVTDIPCDYFGVMGVPITFLDKYNPEQFEILGLTSGRNEFDPLAYPTKRYINALQHNKDGSIVNGSKANTRATLVDNNPTSVYYTADNSIDKLVILYARILIRRKQNEN